MDFKEYQTVSQETAIYPVIEKKFLYPVLGMLGEAGEVAEKVKRIFRDGNQELSDESRQDIAKELGDVLWYLSQIATDLDLSLENIAMQNIQKLQDRKNRGQLHGSGDNR